MISNERVQALIACDRETLIALIAVALASGRGTGPHWNRFHDPDLRALMDEAERMNAPPVTWILNNGTWERRERS